MSENSESTSSKRGWLIIGGVVSLLAGFFAIAAPGIFSAVLTQFLGALLLVTGVVGIFQALVIEDEALDDELSQRLRRPDPELRGLGAVDPVADRDDGVEVDRKSTRLNSSHRT